MSLFSPTSETANYGIGDIISEGIGALRDVYTAKKEAEAKVEVTSTLAGSPYAAILMILVFGLVAYVVVKSV